MSPIPILFMFYVTDKIMLYAKWVEYLDIKFEFEIEVTPGSDRGNISEEKIDYPLYLYW